ncbi:hypothetical protein KKD19_01970 [Patescibacteria group bacterium]|nr:hypothetical protein [Patescibacteria group bacterium]MCG2693345.1 hypothetical protein [Candidatus Parcubacteria bacterium]
MSDLEKSILSVIVYFDIFDYPLTLMEVGRYSDTKSWMSEVRKCLEYLSHEGLVMSRDGFYFLKDRHGLVSQRMQRYNIAERKFRRALRVLKILKSLPFVRMIAVCNNLAYSNARDKSDIDLFIVSKAGRIWCCRFFILMALKILGLRPKGEKTRDKICASFFTTEESLDLEKIKLADDIYLHYWLEQVAPIFDEGIYDKFRGQNLWVCENDYGWEMIGRRKLLNCRRPRALSFVERSKGGIAKLLRCFCEKLFLNVDERFYRWLQMRIMPRRLKDLANKNTDVIVNDRMLKFHDNDRRGYYRDEFKRRIIGQNIE